MGEGDPGGGDQGGVKDARQGTARSREAKKTKTAKLVSLVVCGVALSGAVRSNASGYVVTLVEIRPNVEATGSGAGDLTGLTLGAVFTGFDGLAFVAPAYAEISIGFSFGQIPVDRYDGLASSRLSRWRLYLARSQWGLFHLSSRMSPFDPSATFGEGRTDRTCSSLIGDALDDVTAYLGKLLGFGACRDGRRTIKPLLRFFHAVERNNSNSSGW